MMLITAPVVCEIIEYIVRPVPCRMRSIVIWKNNPKETRQIIVR